MIEHNSCLVCDGKGGGGDGAQSLPALAKARRQEALLHASQCALQALGAAGDC